MFLTLALVTALFTPAKPTVGDRVTITFEQPAQLDPSPDFEVISRSGNRIVLRTFQPKPLALSGTVGGTPFRNLILPVQSVLHPKDDLEPAPLVPPVLEPAPRRPWILVGIAGLAAMAAWLAAYLLGRRRHAVPKVARPPAEAFREAVAKAARARQPWAALADATRVYLASRGVVGRELTTAELLAQLPSSLGPAGPELATHVAAVADILQRGDLEKFSPWGAPPGDFAAVAQQALDLIPVVEPPPPAEVAA